MVFGDDELFAALSSLDIVAELPADAAAGAVALEAAAAAAAAAASSGIDYGFSAHELALLEHQAGLERMLTSEGAADVDAAL